LNLGVLVEAGGILVGGMMFVFRWRRQINWEVVVMMCRCG